MKKILVILGFAALVAGCGEATTRPSSLAGRHEAARTASVADTSKGTKKETKKPKKDPHPDPEIEAVAHVNTTSWGDLKKRFRDR